MFWFRTRPCEVSCVRTSTSSGHIAHDMPPYERGGAAMSERAAMSEGAAMSERAAMSEGHIASA